MALASATIPVTTADATMVEVSLVVTAVVSSSSFFFYAAAAEITPAANHPLMSCHTNRVATLAALFVCLPKMYVYSYYFVLFFLAIVGSIHSLPHIPYSHL